MALRTPEQTLQDAYWDGLQAASAHGFQINYSPGVGFSSEYTRQTGERRTEPFSFLAGTLLTSPDMKSFVSVMMEKRLGNEDLVVRLTIGALHPPLKPIDHWHLLLSLTPKNIRSLVDGWQAEVSFCPHNNPGGRLYVDSKASHRIPGMWLLDSEKGRPALRAVMEDPFFFWERYQKLVALGHFTDEVATG